MLARESKPSIFFATAGMGTNFGPTDGFSTERDKICYAERARGGAAMIITEEWWSPAMRAIIGASLCSFDNRFIAGFADLRKALHHRRQQASSSPSYP
jgi:2,4-dienoyl-CoA reductase-like NADH-dependent reductase (Old Yellow Enzyme family)